LSYKFVYFHKLNYYERVLIKDKKKADTFQKKYKSESELRQELSRIFKEHIVANCLKLEEGANQVTLEIISESNDFIFARLGKMQDIKTVHLRNKKTLKASPIQKAVDQEIEIFTYILIDKNNMVCTYIRESGAPYIKKLENIITKYRIDENMFLEVVPITVDDMIKVLKEKQIISKIDYTISLPTDELLNRDNLDLPVDDFLNLKNLKSAKIQITITGETNKNIVENIKENIGKIVNRIKRNKLGKTEQISITARKEGEYSQTYDIFDDIFAKKTRIDTKVIDEKIKQLNPSDQDYYEKVEEIIHNQIKEKLLEVYRSNKEEVEKYIRVSSD
jgi:hypothetical protein